MILEFLRFLDFNKVNEIYFGQSGFK